MQSRQTYTEKLKDERWLAKRRNILARDKCTCQSCGDQQGIMQVHHKYYKDNRDPWDYPDEALILLCKSCHGVEENGRKEAFRDLNTAIADAGFTREDLQKLTYAFGMIKVRPIASYILTSNIYRGITDAWFKFDENPPIYEMEDGTLISGSEKPVKKDSCRTLGEFMDEYLDRLERRANHG